MSNNVCDIRKIFNIVGSSMYKATIFDNIPTVVVNKYLGASTNIGLVFAASAVGYTIRGIARECDDEYIAPLTGYTQYLGGLVGGAVKYTIKGMSSSVNILENAVLGAINNFAYEVMTDAKLNITSYIISAAVLEGSEPILSHIMFRSNDKLYVDVFIGVCASLVVSANAYFVYENICYHINEALNTTYDYTMYYIGYNTTVYHDDL
ncbi:MAG: hypothetical protein AB8U25_06875 [Rickettsiales endosymbiont of Dermacentor nuttalli]